MKYKSWWDYKQNGNTMHNKDKKEWLFNDDLKVGMNILEDSYC